MQLGGWFEAKSASRDPDLHGLRQWHWRRPGHGYAECNQPKHLYMTGAALPVPTPEIKCCRICWEAWRNEALHTKLLHRLEQQVATVRALIGT